MDDQATGNESGTSTDIAAAPGVEPGAAPAADLNSPAAGTIVGDGVALEDGEAPEEPEFSPPAIEADTGIALDGEYPINHRLRAERLVRKGEESDPDGVISDELVANTKGRLEAEDRAAEVLKAEEEERNPPVRANMKTADLDKIAEAQGIDLSAAANNEDRVSLIEAARAAGTATPANEGG